MKSFLNSMTLLTVFSSFGLTAQAGQALDKIKGPITCQAGTSASLTISANRGKGTGEFTVIQGNGVSTTYSIYDVFNGDVSTYYQGKSRNGEMAAVGFDDQGDRINFGGFRSITLPLSHCHKEKNKHN